MATAPPQTSNVAIEWASPAQQWLYEAGPQPTLLIGGVNAAKTHGACLKLLKLAFDYPHSHVAIVRKTFKHLWKTTMQTFYGLLDHAHYEHGARNDNEGYLRLNNGTEFFFIHLDAPNSISLLSGLELNFAFVDQAEEISEQAWEILETRISRWRYAEVPDKVLRDHVDATGLAWPWNTRDGKPIPPPYLFATANPPGDELHWLFDHFCEESAEWKDKWRGLGYQYRRTDSRENRFASQDNIDVLLARDEAWVSRFVRGEWGRPEGCIFRIDPRSILQYDPLLISRIRNTMRLGRSLDHGDSAPTCCLWFGVDGEGNIFCFQEYYMAGVSPQGREVGISDHRRAITEMSRGLSIRTNLADPQIFDKSRGVSGFIKKAERWSIADEYTDRTLIQEDTAIYWESADNGEPVTRSRLREHLRLDPLHKNPITGEVGAPHLYFIEASDEYPQGCDRVLAEIRAQRRVQVGESNGRGIFSDERDPTVVDHAYDSCKYFVVSHPLPPPTALPPRGTHALARDDGHVILQLPPVGTLPLPRRSASSSGRRWRSRAGGY